RNTERLAKSILAIGPFELVGEGEQLPLVAFRIAGDQPYDEFDVASQLAAERRQGEADEGAGEADAELLPRGETRRGPERRVQDARGEGRRPALRAQASPHGHGVLASYAGSQ